MNHWYEFKASASGEETEILLYGEIGGFGVSAESFVAALKQVPKDHRINLRIYSPGGSVFDGNVIHGALARHPGGVTTHIDGLAASMASVIALAGQPVKMASNALYMIHNVSGSAYGDAEDLRKTADLLEKVQFTMVETYKKKTKMTKVAIEEMMAEETWMTAKEAKEMGFIDEITDPMKMAASFDLSKFRNAPKFDTTAMIMTYETPEYLEQQATLKSAQERFIALTADFDKLSAERTEVFFKLEEANAKAAKAEATVTELSVSIEKINADNLVALADFDKKVGDKAAALLAQTGTTPIKLGVGADKKTVTRAEFAAMAPYPRSQFIKSGGKIID